MDRTHRVTFRSKANAMAAAIWFVTREISFSMQFDYPNYVFAASLTKPERELLDNHVNDMRRRLDVITYESVAEPS